MKHKKSKSKKQSKSRTKKSSQKTKREKVTGEPQVVLSPTQQNENVALQKIVHDYNYPRLIFKEPLRLRIKNFFLKWYYKIFY